MGWFTAAMRGLRTDVGAHVQIKELLHANGVHWSTIQLEPANSSGPHLSHLSLYLSIFICPYLLPSSFFCSLSLALSTLACAVAHISCR